MADTNFNVFNNAVASALTANIFPAIVQGFAAKGVATSVEELIAMTHTPVVRAFAPAIPTPNINAMGFGGAVPQMSPAVAPTAARKNTATAAPVAGRTCMYQFKRGEKKNLFCGKATAPGSDYCNGCVKTRKNLPKEAAAGMPPGTAPGGGVPPGLNGYGGMYGQGAHAPPPATDPNAAGEFTVLEYDPNRNLFRDPVNNFIVTQTDAGIIVLGRLNEQENKINPLTQQEKDIALNLGLVIQGDAPPPQPVRRSPAVPVPNVPTMPVPGVPVPSVPFPAAVPAIPTGVRPNPVNEHPMLPVINQVAPAQHVPAIPAIPTIPQMRA